MKKQKSALKKQPPEKEVTINPFIDELMISDDVHLIEEGGNEYAIRALGRGLNLFFRENDKGLICQIEAEHGVIYQRSIKIWSTTNEKMNDGEKERVSGLIFKFYKLFYNPDAIISDSKNF